MNDTNEAGNVPEVSLTKSSDTKQAESITKGLRELARERAEDAWRNAMQQWQNYDGYVAIVEAYGVECMKLGLERAKAKADDVLDDLQGDWDEDDERPSEIQRHIDLAAQIVSEIDKEIEALK